MKVLFLILVLFVLSNCANQSVAFKDENVLAKPSPTVDNHNANNSTTIQNEASKIDEAKQKELEAQNEKFKIAPDDFKQIDFKNFSYPYKFSYGEKKKINVSLKDGEYEFDFLNDGGDRGWFSFKDAYYVDLTSDGKQEAIIILWHVSCGYGSCDGGAGLFYIYTIRQNKLKSLWQFETGSLAYGCGLKSFTVKDGKITMELFRSYIDETSKQNESGKKFYAEDTTRIVFGFNGKKFVEEKKEFIDVPERSVLNYRPEISINE